MADPFFSRHSICLNIASDRAVLNGNALFLILVVSTKKQYLTFLKRVFVFQKICFKVKVLKTFETFTDFHLKTCRSLKRRAILKIPSTVFRRIYALSVGFKMKTLKKKRFQLLRQKPTQICRKSY